MNPPTLPARQRSGFNLLRRLAQAQTHPAESCDFCSARLPPGHRHLLEVATRRMVCACDACALRFVNVVGGRFKLVPRDTRALTDFQMTDAQWESLALPIDLAFFCHNSVTGKTSALYPSPGGATESLLTLENWNELVASNPVLDAMEPDVEALLVNRVRRAREYFIVPIDVAFELVGVIRMHWRGFSGGEAVWREIEKFFARLRPAAPAPTMEEVGHA